MKEINLRIDDKLLESALDRARYECTTLEELFHNWLKEYTNQPVPLQHYDEVVAALKGKLHVGRKLTREEMNER